MGNSTYWVAGAVVVAAAAAGGYFATHRNMGAGESPAAIVKAPEDFAIMATPSGVTIAALGNSRGEDGILHLRQFIRLKGEGAKVLADARQMTLYTYDKDTVPGKSACDAECLKSWPALGAPIDAKAFGDWSVVAREDGSKQWAYKGKPLYSFVKDGEPGDAKGNGAAEGVWHAAMFAPSTGGSPPYSIAVADVTDAGGMTLVNDTGRTIYAYYGGKRESGNCGAGPCGDQWVPVSAPAIAHNIGDYTVVPSSDGTRQWAYKGLPLFTFAGDVAPSQVNGLDVDGRWKPAVVVRYPTPAQIVTRSTLANGKIMTTPDGRSIYRQHLYTYSVVGHDFQHGAPYSMLTGRAIGVGGCNADCTKVWTPFVAPKDAQPSGYWTILNRADGVRQWAYKDYALYTFSGDKKAGDLLGLNTWNLSINDPAIRKVSLLDELKIDPETMSALFWTTAYP